MVQKEFLNTTVNIPGVTKCHIKNQFVFTCICEDVAPLHHYFLSILPFALPGQIGGHLKPMATTEIN